MGIQQKNEKTYRGGIPTKQDRNNTTILLPLPGLPAVFISGFRLSGKVFTFAVINTAVNRSILVAKSCMQKWVWLVHILHVLYKLEQ